MPKLGEEGVREVRLLCETERVLLINVLARRVVPVLAVTYECTIRSPLAIMLAATVPRTLLLFHVGERHECCATDILYFTPSDR